MRPAALILLPGDLMSTIACEFRPKWKRWLGLKGHCWHFQCFDWVQIHSAGVTHRHSVFVCCKCFTKKLTR
jgi:hypothetical protein